MTDEKRWRIERIIKAIRFACPGDTTCANDLESILAELDAARRHRQGETRCGVREPSTTKRQRDLMRHALGLDGRHAEPRRNAFCAEVGGSQAREIEALIEMGLMRRGPLINDGQDFYASVTDAGKREVMP
jgi:hypothetical protein